MLSLATHSSSERCDGLAAIYSDKYRIAFKPVRTYTVPPSGELIKNIW